MKLFPAARNGVTITELIIALMVVAIMMGGVMAVNLAVHSMDRQEQAALLLTPRLLAMATQVREDAMTVTGDAADLGIRMNNIGLDDNTNFLCFRGETAIPPTPADYTDDLWACYSRRNRAGQWTDLFRCPGQAIPGACMAGGTFVGQLAVNTFQASPPSFAPETGFVLRLITRSNPALAASADNPEASMTISVFPPGHSF